MIAKGDDYKYNGGKGVMVRFLNEGMTPGWPGFSGPGKLAVATFWSNDIKAVTQIYPDGDSPWCPSDGCTDDPFLNPVVSVVVGKNMKDIFYDFDNIQSDDWGWGIFYASDSNSADSRCMPLGKSGDWYYNCPGYGIATDEEGWQQESGVNPYLDDKFLGSGDFTAGNPFASPDDGKTYFEGGGSGCHSFNSPGEALGKVGYAHQLGRITWNGGNARIQDKYCQCYYEGWKSDHWKSWVKDLTAELTTDGADWLPAGKMPAWILDWAACWVNNPRDMINLQNQLWDQRKDYLDFKTPISSNKVKNQDKFRRFWGWNEVPMNQHDINNPENWDAVIIILPAMYCNFDNGDYYSGAKKDYLNCKTAPKQLQETLQVYIDNKALKVGSKYASDRPGSSVAAVRQLMMDKDGKRWEREFYCESVDIGNKYKMVHDKSSGACYIDKK